MTRRTFIVGSLIAGAAPYLLGSKKYDLFAKPLGEEVALRFPPVFTVGSDLIIKQTSVNIWPEKPSTVLTFNGSFPGPTIVVRKGDMFNARVVNRLTVPSVIHWHGILTPELMDGHPKDSIAAGKSADISFPILQRAGTYFYHSHAHKATASQVYRGLAGFFIVEDATESTLGLPSGAFDVPLLIQDKRTNTNRDLVYSPSMMDNMSGYLGTDILINGTPNAYLDINTTLYRFRLLNGSNARIYKIAFSDGTPFSVISSDGGLLEKPTQKASAFLSPGERIEIVVDFSSHQVGQSIYLKSLDFPYAGMSMSGTPQGTEMNLLKLSVAGSTSSGGILPPTLSTIEKYDLTASKRTRAFTLAMSGMVHTINDKQFVMDRIDETIGRGELERWDFINTGDETHPVHIHGSHFQVLERDGKPSIETNDLGWKDTVMVPAMTTVSVLVRFDAYEGRYLLHCHNLEHEDTGMMLNIQVTPTAGVERDGKIDDKFIISPNPANQNAMLRFGELESDEWLEIIDIDGRVWSQAYLEKGDTVFRLDTSGLPSGKYVARLGTLVKELIIMR